MATKIDNEKLDQYIGELNSLHTEWVNYKKNPVDQGDNGGGTIAQMVELTKSLQDIQNEIYRDEVNEDIVEEIDKKISCSVY